LLQGRGRFVDDLKFPDALQAAFVRSPHAHAAIRGIDGSAARKHPGVHAVLTLTDLAPLLSQERIPLQFRTAALPADITQFVLAKDEVAFVGEAVAVVIAEPDISPRTRPPWWRSTTRRYRRCRTAARRSHRARRLRTGASRRTSCTSSGRPMATSRRPLPARHTG